jgi:hypothetical protein
MRPYQRLLPLLSLLELLTARQQVMTLRLILQMLCLRLAQAKMLQQMAAAARSSSRCRTAVTVQQLVKRLPLQLTAVL